MAEVAKTTASRVASAVKSYARKPSVATINVFAHELGKDKRVSVNIYENTPLVSIREFYSKNGMMLPGVKGIALSKVQWESLLSKKDEITAALAKAEAQAAAAKATA